MNSTHPSTAGESNRAIPKANEWEMVSAFVLSLVVGKIGPNDCLLVPIGESLESLGIEESLLCEISYAVEKTGEEMRSNCPEGKLECVNVRVYVSLALLRRSKTNLSSVKYFINKQIASSESDNLEAMDHPCCYIDLYVY